MADAGKIVITPKGVYSSTATYEWLDEVSHDGKSYIALKTVTGVTPSDDGVNWRLFLDPNDIVAGNLIPTFTGASTRNNIISGENLSTILGKVKKYFTDLKGHAFNDTVNNLTTETTGSALDASQGKVLQGEVDEINSNLTQLEISDIAGGKNLLPQDYITRTVNGVTFTVNEDKSITVNGTATAEADFYIKGGWGSTDVIIKATKPLKINRVNTGNGMGFNVINNTSVIADSTGYITKDITCIFLRVSSGVTIDNVTVYPMVRYADIEDDTYETYIPSVKMLTKDVDSVKNDLGGLSFSVSGTTLSITDGANTWTLTQ